MADLKTFAFAVLILAILAPAVQLPAAETEGWTEIDVTIRLIPRLNLSAEAELRFNKALFNEQYLKNLRAGFTYELFKNFRLGLSVKREITETEQFSLLENRYILVAGWHARMARILELDCRFLGETRRFEEGLAENHLRFRLRVLLRAHLKVWIIKCIPFFGIEPFFDTLTDEVSRNRIHAGVFIPFHKWLRLKLSYIRDEQKYNDVRHVAVTGMHITL
jgi:hypothetical protein